MNEFICPKCKVPATLIALVKLDLVMWVCPECHQNIEKMKEVSDGNQARN